MPFSPFPLMLESPFLAVARLIRAKPAPSDACSWAAPGSQAPSAMPLPRAPEGTFQQEATHQDAPAERQEELPHQPWMPFF